MSYLKCTFGILAILLISNCNNAQKDSSTIQIGICADYPPFESRNANNELIGFDVDLSNIIGQKLGKGVKFVDMSFSALLNSVQSGRVDMVISSTGITEERKKQVDFSVPYFFNRLTVVSRKDATLQDENTLRDKKIGVQLGSTFAHWAKTRNLTNVTTMDLNPQLIEALKSKQIDGVIIDHAQAAIFCKKNQALTYHFLAHDEKGTAVVFQKGSSLRIPVNKILEELKTSGQLQKLETKWL